MTEKVDAELAKLELPDADEKSVRLGELWKGRTALLVWLRHFG